VDFVFDVGANDGGYHQFIRNEVGFKGQIVSFEPVTSLATHCRAVGLGDPSWEVYGVALGDRDGESEINVMENSQFSSFLQPSTNLTAAFAAANTPRATERVQVKRLDSIMPDLKRQFDFRTPYLKVDIQGFDLAVFAGAGELLQDFVALQTELSLRPIYQGMPAWQDVLSVLEAKGFAVSNMFAVNHDDNLRAIEFDCVMVNDRFAMKTPAPLTVTPGLSTIQREPPADLSTASA
jgi:FkbM family methyltransferase